MSFFNNPNRIPETYGLRIALALMGYFILMQLLGWHHNVELRLLNLVILVAGVYLALKKFKATHGNHLNYFKALVTGVATAAIGTVLFAIFMFAYMQIDAGLMESIRQNEPMGRFLNPYMAAFIVALEGVFSGLLVTFIIINYIETDEVNVPQGID